MARVFVKGHVAADVGELLLPLVRLALPQIIGDPARKAVVLVRAVDFRPDGHVLLLEAQHGRAVEPLLIVLTLAECRLDPLRHFGGDLYALDDISEEPREVLFANAP